MTPIERFLILGILFLGVLRVLLGIIVDHPSVAPQAAAPAMDEPATAPDGAYDWNPAAFTRRGIPAKLTLMPDGRVPDTIRLTDTQKAFVYAAMIDSYDSVLTRAKRDCATDMRRDIVRWQARHAAIITDATRILDLLTPGRNNARQAHDGMPQDVFATRMCPTIEHYIRTGAYDPHPEAVDRLAHAARSTPSR
ncbi:hypothetical protein KFF05_05825 [bacterium SCSIO 12827]|nr:hypothetical protein KFF05_05825 [bacterium SCSIO 12827]